MKGLVLAGGMFDRACLAQRANELGVGDLLQRVLDEVAREGAE